MTFRAWLEALQAIVLGDLSDILADPDLLGALRLWHSAGWSPDEAAAALRDGGAL
jgi:hypothetical protein